MTEKGKSVSEKVIVSQRIGKAITSRVPTDEPIGSSDTSYDIGRCKRCGAELHHGTCILALTYVVSSHLYQPLAVLSQGLCLTWP